MSWENAGLRDDADQVIVALTLNSTTTLGSSVGAAVMV